SIEGAFWAQGFTDAEDRFNQMNIFRHGARGESAALEGKGSVRGDIRLRERGYTIDEFKEMGDLLEERSRKILAAYAEGVNACIATRGIETRPWEPVDTIAIGVMMARRFGEAGDVELTIQQFFQQIAAMSDEETAQSMLNDLFRLSDPSAPTTLNDHARSRKDLKEDKEGGFRPGPRISPEWYREYVRERDEALAAREALGLPVYFGSNAWAVAPSKSKSGNAMLYGGPMMGFRAPSICNEAHLNAPGLNVAGMSFPGVPCIMIGFNEHIAWTTTSGGADLVDVYVLELNPENPEQYKYKGEWKSFEKVAHEIPVKDGDPQTLVVYRSVYGPLAGKRDPKNNRAHALAMSFWKKETLTFEAVFDMNFAATTKEFQEAARKITTSHNFFVADDEGHIGFWFCGRHPARKKGHDPRLPQPGDGSMDWEGFVPFEKMPQAVDPADGFFANWNNKPARDWEPMAFGKIFWGKKIIDELEGNEKVDMEKVWSISRETAYHSFLADYFLPHLLPLVEDAELKKRLGAWDHMSRDGALEPALVKRWLAAIMKRVFDEFGVMAALEEVQRYLMDPLLYLFEGDGSVVRPRHDWIGDADLEDLAKEALAEVLKRGTERIKYREPKINFRRGIGKIPSAKGRGTYQMAVELTKEGPIAWTLAAPGQCEDPESKHYKDQVELFGAWKYKKFVFKRDEMK
ncbi:MAG: penicillin acylase family protein, partial [Planctomycetota bacterium]